MAVVAIDPVLISPCCGAVRIKIKSPFKGAGAAERVSGALPILVGAVFFACPNLERFPSTQTSFPHRPSTFLCEILYPT